MSDAWALWDGVNRASYEEQAGLTRVSMGVEYRLGFASPKLEAVAAQWVWRYPEQLLKLFAAISSEQILFGNYGDDEEEALFLGYLSALKELAHRAPGLFGAKWLEALLQDFAGWVRESTPELEAAAGDIFEFLAQLESQKRRKMFWARFEERMGRLAALLYRDDSQRVVEPFLERLVRRGLGELALKIIHRMGAAMPGEQKLTWIERCINGQDADARAFALWELASQALQNRSLVGPALAKLQAWLRPPAPGRGPSPTWEAAVAFPAFLFDEAASRDHDSSAESSPLLNILHSTAEGTETFQDFCEAAMSNRQFGPLAGRFLFAGTSAPPEEKRPSLAMATALYQCAAALPEAERGRALKLMDVSYGHLTFSEQDAVAGWWTELAERCDQDVARIEDRDEPDGQRHYQALARNYEIAKDLLRH